MSLNRSLMPPSTKQSAGRAASTQVSSSQPICPVRKPPCPALRTSWRPRRGFQSPPLAVRESPSRTIRTSRGDAARMRRATSPESSARVVAGSSSPPASIVRRKSRTSATRNSCPAALSIMPSEVQAGSSAPSLQSRSEGSRQTIPCPAAHDRRASLSCRIRAFTTGCAAETGVVRSSTGRMPVVSSRMQTERKASRMRGNGCPRRISGRPAWSMHAAGWRFSRRRSRSQCCWERRNCPSPASATSYSGSLAAQSMRFPSPFVRNPTTGRAAGRSLAVNRLPTVRIKNNSRFMVSLCKRGSERITSARTPY